MALSIAPDISAIITGAAQRYGIDPRLMLGVAQIESGGNPAAKNPNSSAGGLFQFIDSTAKGYGLANRYDAGQASDAAARLMLDNKAYLTKALGREPTAGELYLAHQQGAGGAAKLLSNPQAAAADLVGADAVRLNGGSDGMTAADFAGLWGEKLAKVLGDAVPDVGPAAANPSPSGIPDDAFRKAVSAVLEPTKAEKVSAAGNALYNLSATDLGLSSFRRRPTIAIGRG